MECYLNPFEEDSGLQEDPAQIAIFVPVRVNVPKRDSLAYSAP